MKAILVVDFDDNIKIEDCSVQIVWNDTFPIELEQEVYFKPMPSKRISAVEWLNGIKTHEPTEYDKGWNDCVDMLEGENNE